MLYLSFSTECSLAGFELTVCSSDRSVCFTLTELQKKPLTNRRRPPEHRWLRWSPVCSTGPWSKTQDATAALDRSSRWEMIKVVNKHVLTPLSKDALNWSKVTLIMLQKVIFLKYGVLLYFLINNESWKMRISINKNIKQHNVFKFKFKFRFLNIINWLKIKIQII